MPEIDISLPRGVPAEVAPEQRRQDHDRGESTSMRVPGCLSFRGWHVLVGGRLARISQEEAGRIEKVPSLL